jgi:hypothetical protein
MKYAPFALMLFLCGFKAEFNTNSDFIAPNSFSDYLKKSIGKKVELTLIESGIKPKAKFIVSKIELGFCLFTAEKTDEQASELQAITLPIERILTLRALSAGILKLTAL